ncbi:MAG: heptose 1-phosphate adenyltransferase [Coxiella sp. DG_40]|nr:MAG: heptose 1-phosphate adenyltransferase [Coxiella sp. DG_40]
MNINLPNFEKIRVLVVGDVMLDRYWKGDASRISPEAPIPIVHIKEFSDSPGGASNVALNVKALGTQVVLLGLIGKDETGKILQNKLNEKGVNHQLQIVPELPTIAKTRIIAHNQQLIRLDFEKNFFDIDTQELIKIYKTHLNNTNIVIISDYGKGIANCVKQIIQLARLKNIPVLVDPKGRDFSIYHGATLITPNLSEFETIVGPCRTDQELEQKGLELLQANNFTAVLVTRGAQGMSLIHKAEKTLHIPTQVHEIYDVTGAGDTVIATLAVALSSGEHLAKACELANIAASIVVRKLGAVSISAAELRRTLRKRDNSWLGITSKEQLLQDVADAKAHGETIVMTNGCFDILHTGHISYLEQAKSLGSRLIVAINDDDSVKKLKGPKRPVNSLEKRMVVLAGLRCVDWVIPFSEDTPEELITAITPDVLVKGGDWQVDEIIGAKHVIKHGGVVQSLPYVDNYSTTDIISRIRGSKQ